MAVGSTATQRVCILRSDGNDWHNFSDNFSEMEKTHFYGQIFKIVARRESAVFTVTNVLMCGLGRTVQLAARRFGIEAGQNTVF
jgi:hypothetical protein